MDTFVKLQDVAVHMELEPAEEVGPAGQVAPCGQVVSPTAGASQTDPSLGARATRERRTAAKHAALGVTRVALPNGQTMPLLKTMLTTACERDCHYCPFRAGRSTKRITFSPDEMAAAFMQMVRAGVVDGLFLSSGIIGGGQRTQDKLLDTVSILRQKHQYSGYIHLKVMPGADREQVRRSMQLADRLSVNLEGANQSRLLQLAPKKRFHEELLAPLRWMEEIRRNESPEGAWKGRWASSVTQFVVGAAGESDVELLATTEFLTRHLSLKRAYYSRFSPLRDTPLENHPPEDPWRVHRLYQASFLVRDYGFELEEMPFTQDGRLPLDRDPKLAWAETALRDAPVELNKAEREQLLRVPGIGLRSAATILNARRRGTLRFESDLRQLGVPTKRLRPYVLLDGKRPSFQLPLFPALPG